MKSSNQIDRDGDGKSAASGSSRQYPESGNRNVSLLKGGFDLHLPSFEDLTRGFERQDSLSKSSNYQSAYSQVSDSDISYASQDDHISTLNANRTGSKSETSDNLVYIDALDSIDISDNPRINTLLSKAANQALNGSFEVTESFRQNESFMQKLKKPIVFEDEDLCKDMTYGRRIALKLSKYSWYNPSVNLSKLDSRNHSTDEEIHDLKISNSSRDTELPRLESAWAYFEHMTLPRYIVGQNKTLSFQEWLMSMLPFADTRKIDVAVPGETMYYTKLYSPLMTPLNQMGDFGLGVGLYFATLHGLLVLLVICALMNIPNMIFFASEDYSAGQENVSWYLKGSAVCNLQSWVPCPGCSPDDFRDKSRIQQSSSDDGSTIMFALKNNCDGGVWRVGMINFGTTLLVLVGFLVLSFYLGHMEVQFDEDEQTAQDYSVAFRNPPTDATEPEEWLDFLEQAFPGCKITCCTVAVDNDDLIHNLVRRREILKAIKEALPEGERDTSLSNIRSVAQKIVQNRNIFQRLFARVSGGIPEHQKKLLDLNTQIIELCNRNYPASSVFVTLETEQWQRHILDNLVVAHVHVANQSITSLKNQKYLFRGIHVLNVVEPAEPSTIRWLDLDITLKDHVMKVVYTLVMVGIIAAVAALLTLIHDRQPTSFAIANSISNAAIPSVAKVLTAFEKHRNEEDRQVWLFIRIAIFRLFNTVILINWFITPITSSIMDGSGNLLAGVYTIFFAEIVTASILQLLDISENFKRHFVAPRSKTQEKMNLNMKGTEVLIAERYTNMVKLLFMALWYCPLYPGVLIMCAIALYVNYYVDRFSLMRSWKPAPKLGRSISRFTRRFILPLMLVFMAFVATTSWANFPYDNLCLCNSNDSCFVSEGLYFMDPIEIAQPNTTVIVRGSDPVYKFCTNEQEWMTGEQKRLTQYFSRLNFSVLGLISFVIFVMLLLFARRYYVRDLEFVGEPKEQHFSDVASRTAYIPEIKSTAFAYPFICCPVDNLVGCDLFEWEDHNRSYEYYDITKDVDEIFRQEGKVIDRSRVLFSRMIHNPPSVLDQSFSDNE